MNRINIFIADNQYLVLEGLKTLIKSNKDFKVVGEAENSAELLQRIVSLNPHVLIIDYTSSSFKLTDITVVKNLLPNIKILAITPDQSKLVILGAIKSLINSHLLKDCDKNEIIESIYATAKGEKFYCNKLLDTIINETEAVNQHSKYSNASCEGLNISEREVEIIKLIAEGYSNKQVADLLFLSTHTVNTHRKNIMNKLGVNNTAGIVIFAVKEHIISPNKFLFSSQ